MDKTNPVFRSLEIIENRIMEKLTVENIAHSVFFSKYHYGRIFREIVGETVMEYVTKRKLSLAGRDLLETGATITEIAFNYGFESREGFTRSFKEYMGVTPTEYRKYGLSSISQKTAKGKSIMLYSKNTDEILRELNEFIAKAKETAAAAGKYKGTINRQFWANIAKRTDYYADELQKVLDGISAISEHPDEITNRFKIINSIEIVGINTNIMALSVAVNVARHPQEEELQKPLGEKFFELALSSMVKAQKISSFFSELSALIFEDMRKSAAAKLAEAAETGNKALNSIKGYQYIKKEIERIINCLTVLKVYEINEFHFEDIIFQLNILDYSADINCYEDKEMFSGIKVFREKVIETHHFFRDLVKPETNPEKEYTLEKFYQDIAFQMNILMHFYNGEMSEERLGVIQSTEQKAAVEAINKKISDSIRPIINGSMPNDIGAALLEVHGDMLWQAEQMGEHGGPVRVFASEILTLCNKVKEIEKELTPAT